MIIWAGTSNKDVGMVIEHYPKIIVPPKSQEVQTIPGRNGEIILSNNSFENYEQEYQAFLDAKYLGGLTKVMPKITSWLLGHEGYQRLEDSYFPDVYRMAYYSGGAEFVNIFNEYGEGTLTFNCAPERYYKIGEQELTLSRGQTLINPSVFPAQPIIKITNTGSAGTGTITFNGSGLTINGVPHNMIIDTKLHKAYYQTNNYNSIVSGDYEDLKLGERTVISWSGYITGVTLIPRWWTI